MRRSIFAVGILSAAALLAGCSGLFDKPSPVSTIEGADGETVTVEWVDYPGEAGQDSAALLTAPDQGELEPAVRELIDRMRSAVEQAGDVELESATAESEWFGEDRWFASGGNGYGGESMLITLNCCDLQSDTAPAESRWPAVLAAASAVTEEYGLGPLVLDHESAAMKADPAWAEDYAKQFCNGPDDRCWLWSATAYADGQWVYLSIQDAALDATGAALDDAKEYDSPVASIGISYGATVIRSGMRDDFERAYAPFEGLDKPAATTSD